MLGSDGSLKHYKASLVALENRPEYGVDYEKSFAPITKMIISAIATYRRWSLRQMDVKNVSLYGDLKEDIYMTTLAGLFLLPSSDVCKIKRSLYGLKQALRTWFDKFRW